MKLPYDLISMIDTGLPRNAWVDFHFGEIYFRRSRRPIDGNLVDMIDVANVEVYENMRGHGYFTELMQELEKKLQTSAVKWIYVENVLNERLQPFLLSRGFVPREGWPGAPSYVKRIQ